MTQRNRFAGMVAVLAMLGASAWAQFTTYEYTGAYTDPQKWDQEENWETGGVVNGFPSGYAHVAEIMTAVTFTSGVPASISRLYTGSGQVVLGQGLNLLHVSGGYGPILNVGSGGLDCGSGTITTANDLTVVTAGDLKAGVLSSAQGGTYTQTGGSWRVANFTLPRRWAAPIPDWSFGQETSIIQTHSNGEASITFEGQPTFENSVRPDWVFSSGSNTGVGLSVDLKGHTLWGDSLELKRGNKLAGDHFYVTSSVTGATVDVNQILINSIGNAPNSYLDLANADIVLRGSGTVWSNGSTNNLVFSVDNNTTVTFDPVGGTATVDTGSQDLGLTRSAFLDNFAFGAVAIGDGDILSLTGDANLGGGNNALYASSLTGLGAGATVDLAGHNLYLLSDASNITFIDSVGGGSFSTIPEPTTATLLLVSILALRRRHASR